MSKLFSKFLLVPFLAMSSLAPIYAATSHTAASKASAPAMTDAQIDATIRTKLAKSKIGKDGLRYSVHGGVVTWEGHTNVMQHKGSATRMAHAAGAKQVVNHIQISEAARGQAVAQMRHASVKQ